MINGREIVKNDICKNQTITNISQHLLIYVTMRNICVNVCNNCLPFLCAMLLKMASS